MIVYCSYLCRVHLFLLQSSRSTDNALTAMSPCKSELYTEPVAAEDRGDS